MLVDVETKIENTSMQMYDDKTYWIKPNEGYKLHAKDFDGETENSETGEITKEFGFTTGIVTCGVNYDFEKNEREFYVVPEDEVVEPESIVPEETATESDYINALESLGVDFNG